MGMRSAVRGYETSLATRIMAPFAHRGVRVKITIAMVLTTLFTVVVGVQGIRQIQAMRDDLNQVQSTNVTNMRLIAKQVATLAGSAEVTARGAVDNRQAAAVLAGVSTELRTLVDRFSL